MIMFLILDNDQLCVEEYIDVYNVCMYIKLKIFIQKLVNIKPTHNFVSISRKYNACIIKKDLFLLFFIILLQPMIMKLIISHQSLYLPIALKSNQPLYLYQILLELKRILIKNRHQYLLLNLNQVKFLVFILHTSHWHMDVPSFFSRGRGGNCNFKNKGRFIFIK